MVDIFGEDGDLEKGNFCIGRCGGGEGGEKGRRG